MKRTTVMLPDELDARLRWEARRRGVAIADIAREAIERHLPPRAPGAMEFFDIGDGEPDDASERVDEFVGREVALRHGGTGSPGGTSG